MTHRLPERHHTNDASDENIIARQITVIIWNLDVLRTSLLSSMHKY